jgi:hypothetical protein
VTVPNIPISPISSLVGIINDKSPDAQWLLGDSTESLAIRVLGEFRAVEAVPALVKWATPPEGGYQVWGLQISPESTPAVQALVKIGKPAEPALLDALRLKPEKPIWEISLGILKKIEGPKCAAIILEEAIAKEAADAPAKEHLQAALKKLKEEK